jgi:hypothetical protein
MEKVDNSPDCTFIIQNYLAAKGSAEQDAAILSGQTLNCITYDSSSLLDTGNGESKVQPPNFVTECFFLCHILISFTSQRIEKFYMENNKRLNKAVSEKNYQ